MDAERRTNQRFDDQSLVFIELESAQPDTMQPAKLALARTLDISPQGMQIATREALAPARILRVFVDNGEEYPLTLVAEVKWARQVDAEYQAGLEIYPSRDTAQNQWAEKVGRKERGQLAGQEPDRQVLKSVHQV